MFVGVDSTTSKTWILKGIRVIREADDYGREEFQKSRGTTKFLLMVRHSSKNHILNIPDSPLLPTLDSCDDEIYTMYILYNIM